MHYSMDISAKSGHLTTLDHAETIQLPLSPRHHSLTQPSARTGRWLSRLLTLTLAVLSCISFSKSLRHPSSIETDDHSITPKIVNGEDYRSYTNNKPHSTALIKVKYQQKYHGRPRQATCTATILTSRYLLTAAHTFTHVPEYSSIPERKSILSMYVKISPESEEDEAQSITVKPTSTNVIIHKDWFYSLEYKRKYLQGLSDIAIVRLPRAIRFHGNIKPVILGASRNIPAEWYPMNRETTVVGYGLTDPYKPGDARTLRTANFKTRTPAWCERKAMQQGYTPRTMKLPDMFCATGKTTPAGESQICFGDSGGPIYTKRIGYDVQIGISAWVDKHCNSNFNGFLRVSDHLRFVYGALRSKPDHTRRLRVVDVGDTMEATEKLNHDEKDCDC